MRKILDQMIENEKGNQHVYYAYQEEVRKQRQAELNLRMERKRAKSQ